MALPVTLGLLSGGIARGMRHVKPTLRDRILWLSSPDASRVLLLAGAAAVMALSLVLTLSRSGMAAMFVALALTGVVTLRRLGGHHAPHDRDGLSRPRSSSRSRRGSASTAIVSRFAQADWSDFNDRRGPWADAAAIVSDVSADRHGPEHLRRRDVVLPATRSRALLQRRRTTTTCSSRPKAACC